VDIGAFDVLHKWKCPRLGNAENLAQCFLFQSRSSTNSSTLFSPPNLILISSKKFKALSFNSLTDSPPFFDTIQNHAFKSTNNNSIFSLFSSNADVFSSSHPLFFFSSPKPSLAGHQHKNPTNSNQSDSRKPTTATCQQKTLASRNATQTWI
jgi:hypothetical protein